MTNGLLVALGIGVALTVGLMWLLARPARPYPCAVSTSARPRPVSRDVRPVLAADLNLIEFDGQTRMHIGVCSSGLCGYQHGTIARRWPVSTLSGLFVSYTLCDGCVAAVADVRGGARVWNWIVALLSKPRQCVGNDDDTILMPPVDAPTLADPMQVAPGISYMPGTTRDRTVLAVAA